MEIITKDVLMLEQIFPNCTIWQYMVSSNENIHIKYSVEMMVKFHDFWNNLEILQVLRKTLWTALLHHSYTDQAKITKIGLDEWILNGK